MYSKAALVALIVYGLHLFAVPYVADLLYYGLIQIFGAGALVTTDVWVNILGAIVIYVLPVAILAGVGMMVVKKWCGAPWYVMTIALVGVYLVSGMLWMFVDTGFSIIDTWSITAALVVSSFYQLFTLATVGHFVGYWVLYVAPFVVGPFIAAKITRAQ